MMAIATRRVDPWLLLGTGGLLLLGVGVAASVGGAESPGAPFEGGPGARQLLLASAGVGVAGAASMLDYHLLRRHALWLYLGALALLVAALVIGVDIHGSRRWLGIGTATLQPSELAKVAVVVMMAALLAGRAASATLTLVALGVATPAIALVVLEPDTGTALVLATGSLAVVIAAGAPWRVVASLLIAAVAVVPLLFAVAVPDYQRERLAVFVDPARDPLGSGFNVRQAEVAISTGGLTGDGLFNEGDSSLEHVAARGSDFVFAQVGEDLGLAGTLAILALFGLVVWRGFEAARAAPDAFGQLLAAGLTSIMVAQAALHIAVNVRLFPATGITLPFVSAGGTSVVTVCLIVGLLQSIAAQRPASVREQWTAARWR
jgi:rod shape determining protein RodA